MSTAPATRIARYGPSRSTGGLAAGFARPDAAAVAAAAADGEGGAGGLSLLAHALLALAALLGHPRPEPFALGPVSALLGAASPLKAALVSSLGSSVIQPSALWGCCHVRAAPPPAP
jgi:hypothetical protein